jgi:molybdopterin converting factor subunit 1
MIIIVRLFARARDLAKADSISVEFVNGATVKELRERIAISYPALGPLLRNSAISVNNEFAEEAATLTEGCEVALIPPVSGGGYGLEAHDSADDNRD